MMRLVQVLVIGLGLISVPPASAGTEAATAGVLQALQKRYVNVPTLQASFVQTTRSALYGNDTQQGTVALERPGKMRWVFEGDGREFVTDGNTLWIWTPEDEQVLRFRDAGGQLTAAQQVLQSLHRVGELFRVSAVSTDPVKGTRLELGPKDGDPVYFQKLLLTLDAALVVREVEVTDPQGTVSVLVFSSVVLGGDLADEQFTFVAPAGAEIVDANP